MTVRQILPFGDPLLTQHKIERLDVIRQTNREPV